MLSKLYLTLYTTVKFISMHAVAQGIKFGPQPKHLTTVHFYQLILGTHTKLLASCMIEIHTYMCEANVYMVNLYCCWLNIGSFK